MAVDISVEDFYDITYSDTKLWVIDSKQQMKVYYSN